MSHQTLQPDPPEREPGDIHLDRGGSTTACGLNFATLGSLMFDHVAEAVTCRACLDVLDRADSPLATATLVDGQLADPVTAEVYGEFFPERDDADFQPEREADAIIQFSRSQPSSVEDRAALGIVDGEVADETIIAPAAPRLVVVASPSPNLPPQLAEVKKDAGGSTVEVIYTDSRTWANVARKRITEVQACRLKVGGTEVHNAHSWYGNFEAGAESQYWWCLGVNAEPAQERTDWAAMSDDELEGRVRGSLQAAAEFPELAPPVGPAPAAERRTVGLEVLTDELRKLFDVWGTRGPLVGIVCRVNGEAVDVPEIQTLWEAPYRKPADVLAKMLTQARSYADGIEGNAGAELLMPGADVLAALAGQPVGRYTASVPSSYGVVQAGWLVGVETVRGGVYGLEWLLVEDRSSCSRPAECVVAGGVAKDCAVVTMRGRGVQHLKSWHPVYVRIPADTAVQR
jgi:hypothetical protein